MAELRNELRLRILYVVVVARLAALALGKALKARLRWGSDG